jgi:uncharacterized protein YdeI (YjbR/CyaY-like superfamily)
MAPRFFKSQSAGRTWFEKNHLKQTELWIGFYKVDSGKGGAGYKEILDEALCFGWIDGIRKNVDEESYTIRFTPRKTKSIWSNVNTKRMKELIDEGKVSETGMAAFAHREDKRAGIYSFEQESHQLSTEFEKKFRKNKKAWKFFTTQAPWYQRTAIHKVMSAKQEATRIKRLDSLIHYSSLGETIPELTR